MNHKRLSDVIVAAQDEERARETWEQHKAAIRAEMADSDRLGKVTIPVDTVDWRDRCPQCDENRTDYLVWAADGATVVCHTCTNEYVPPRRD